jgi:RimJ/RimL family protein N-acetyltransferase
MAVASRVLETTRIHLRPLALEDAAELHVAYGDAQVMRFWDGPPTADIAETAQRIRRSLAVGRKWHAAWGVVLKDTGQFAGMVNYHTREPWNHRLTVGWILARPYWRQGLAREAMAELLDHCFTRLDTHRVEAEIEPENVASIRLAEHLGFQREGVLRDRLLVAGSYRDIHLYGLLRPDWRWPR